MTKIQGEGEDGAQHQELPQLLNSGHQQIADHAHEGADENNAAGAEAIDQAADQGTRQAGDEHRHADGPASVVFDQPELVAEWLDEQPNAQKPRPETTPRDRHAPRQPTSLNIPVGCQRWLAGAFGAWTEVCPRSPSSFARTHQAGQ